MEIWYIILAIVLNAIWIIPFIMEIIIYPLKNRMKYDKKFKKWDSEHPDLLRRRCMDCKYCKKATSYFGRYPHGKPFRYPDYCRLLHIRLSSSHSQRCKIAEPTEEFIETGKKYFPEKNVTVYFSEFGDLYHSSPSCLYIKKSKHVIKSRVVPWDKNPCSRCWVESENTIYPKN